jgi:hypothetical protein
MEGESLGDFDYIRTLMTCSVSVVSTWISVLLGYLEYSTDRWLDHWIRLSANVLMLSTLQSQTVTVRWLTQSYRDLSICQRFKSTRHPNVSC